VVSTLERCLNKGKAAVAACLLLGISALSLAAQEQQLSAEGRNLTEVRAELQRKPDDATVQQLYLEAFPHDWKAFLRLFGYPNGELYDGHEFISVLPSLAKHHDVEVGTLLIQLSKEAEYDADAPSYLQHATAAYAAENTGTFASLVGQLSPTERLHLITFLADVENHSAYKEYQDIINHLKSLGQDSLAKEFEMARKKRQQQPH
jgi:hypothetical protein